MLPNNCLFKLYEGGTSTIECGGLVIDLIEFLRDIEPGECACCICEGG